MGQDFLCNTAGWVMTSSARWLSLRWARGQDASAGGCSSAPVLGKGRLAGSALPVSASRLECVVSAQAVGSLCLRVWVDQKVGTHKEYAS